ncbi:hypothetical protein HN51_015995 [Arachis hypogaea]
MGELKLKYCHSNKFAESRIAVDGVVYVIDCGKANGTSYDALNKLACLLPSSISKASAHEVLPCTGFGCAIIQDISGVYNCGPESCGHDFYSLLKYSGLDASSDRNKNN